MKQDTSSFELRLCPSLPPCQRVESPGAILSADGRKGALGALATPVRVSWPIDLAVQWWDNVMKACHQKAQRVSKFAWRISIESAKETDEASFTV